MTSWFSNQGIFLNGAIIAALGIFGLSTIAQSGQQPERLNKVAGT